MKFIVALALSLITMTLGKSFRDPKTHFSLETIGGDLKTMIHKMNVVPGGFPSNPSYIILKSYSEVGCNSSSIYQSLLMNTCYTDQTTSIMFTCCKYRNILKCCYALNSYFCFYWLIHL